MTEPGGAWFNYVPGTTYYLPGGQPISGVDLLNNPTLNTSPSGNPYVANLQNLQVPPPATNFSAMGNGGNPVAVGGGGGATPWGTAGGLLPGNLSAYGGGVPSPSSSFGPNTGPTPIMQPVGGGGNSQLLPWAGGTPGVTNQTPGIGFGGPYGQGVSPFGTQGSYNYTGGPTSNPGLPANASVPPWMSQGTAAGPGTTGMPGVPGFGQPVGQNTGAQPLPGGGGTPGGTGNPFIDQLTQMIQSGGNPINQTPAWQAMIDAQQRNIQEQGANLRESLNLGGNMFGSGANTTMTDFYNQAAKNQNAMLGQMTAQAGESAAGRMFGAESQLSGQDFQSMMDQFNTSAQMAQLMNQNQAGAAMGMYQGQMGTVSPFLNYALGMQGQNLAGGANLGNLQNQTWGIGGQLGAQQYQQQQNQISNAYQEFLRTQPFNNPLIQMMQSAAFNYPQMIQPGYQPGMLGGMMQGAGGILGGIGALAPLLALCWIAEAVYGVHDPRTHLVRRWISGPFRKTKFGGIVVSVYLKFGQRIAKQIHKHVWLKPLFKSLFDIALRKARMA